MVDASRRFRDVGDAQERAASRMRACPRSPSAWRCEPRRCAPRGPRSIRARRWVVTQEYVKESLVTALEASLELGDAARAEQFSLIIDEPSGWQACHSYFRAQALRFRARLAALDG